MGKQFAMPVQQKLESVFVACSLQQCCNLNATCAHVAVVVQDIYHSRYKFVRSRPVSDLALPRPRIFKPVPAHLICESM